MDNKENLNLKDEVIVFQLQRVFAALSRNILNLMEDVKGIHNNNFEKLYDNLPPQTHPLIDMANYFDDNRYQWMRGRLLDKINEARRDLQHLIDDNKNNQ